MSFERRFVLASRGLALIGVAALLITGVVGPVYLVLAIAGLLWTGWLGWLGRGQALAAVSANIGILISIALIFLPIFLHGISPIQAIAEFLLVLTGLLSLAASTNRDWLLVCALSFFELLAAAALTIEPAFAVLFLLYLLFAPWAFVLLFLRGAITEVGQERKLREEPFVDHSLFRSLATVTLILFVSTVLIFVFFPRMGSTFFPNPFSMGERLSGFSDEISLGDVTALKVNPAVAMRVVVDRPERVLQEQQYWHGATLDTFDGRIWNKGPEAFRPLIREQPGVFLSAEHNDRRALVRQEVILEPMETPTLFFLGVPREARGRFIGVLSDPLGNLRVVTTPGARIRYEIVSSLVPRNDPPTARSREIPSVDPRVPLLARGLVSDATSDASRAERLLDFFHRDFEYTVSPGDPGDADPLARFLFDTRRGHCEYFASSLAIMLRTVGIPSVVVTGYLGGEWNPYGQYLVVRQSDAHSWVEAWVGGEWKILDPTPPTPVVGGSRFADWQAMIDAYRMRWYRYVINYAFQDQIDIAFSMRAATRWAWNGVQGEFWRSGWDAARDGRSSFENGRTGWSAGLTLGVALLVWFLGRQMRHRHHDQHWATKRYLKLLKLLERRGLNKGPGETADEFFGRVSSVLGGDRDTVARLTDLYQQFRFSGRPESLTDRAELDSLLELLMSHR